MYLQVSAWAEVGIFLYNNLLAQFLCIYFSYHPGAQSEKHPYDLVSLILLSELELPMLRGIAYHVT